MLRHLPFFSDNQYLQNINNEFQPSYKKNIQQKSNFKELSKHFKTDYLVYVRVWTGAPRLTSGGVFTLRQKANVSVDFRVWSKQKSDYVYMKRNSVTGKATYYSPSRSVKKGLRKAFEQIAADSTKIRASMM